jgi:membrane-bound metal-dependent hydrolase YbcI (DUF457 family)
MFVGHLAVALAAKRYEPDVNLAWFVAGVSALDLVWPLFVLAGLEHVSIVPGATAFTPLVFDSYPWSHSLVMTAIWALLLVTIARAAKVSSSAWTLLAMAVVSHWPLDFITHAPDMPLWPGDSPKLGLSLWNSIPGTLIIEGAMWLVAIAIYLKTLSQRGQRPGWPFWSLIVVSTLMWATSPWGPLPPDERSVALFSLIGWIVVPWAMWADRARRPRSRTAP